jgi:polyphosphate kinase
VTDQVVKMAKAEEKRSRGRRAASGNGRRDETRVKTASTVAEIDSGALPPLEPEMFINRELSWLEFNSRVLFEAEERTNPLLERVKFAAIFAENFDEFFMIRVAGIKRKVDTGIGTRGPDGRTPVEQLTAVRARTQKALDRYAATITGDLLPGLAAEGIEIVPYAMLNDQQRGTVTRRFEREIFPILTPQAIDRGRRFPHVSNRSLNLIASLNLPDGSRFARIKIPATLPRFMPVTNGSGVDHSRPQVFTWLEQVVAANLGRLFAGADVVASYPFHVTRDSDIDPDEDGGDDDEGNLMTVMRESIAQRAFGPVVRLMIDRTMPDDVRDWLVEHLGATADDLYIVDGPLATDNLWELMAIDRPDLKDSPLTPAPVPRLSAVPGQDPEDVFASIRERDILIHHPYQSFGAVVDFLRAAATDPNVVAIKQTLYRIGRDSPLIPSLIEARDDDTQVAVLVELKARFDEENNISWAEELEHHGVHVAYGLAGLKTHCKATLVVRREASGLRRYVHLATGNYNATTARLYEDFGYLTAREEIGADVSDLFNVLTGFAQQDAYRGIWVAPGGLRQQLLAAIDREVVAHRRHGNGRLVFKINSLVDRVLVRALYRASRAGVKIDLIVRGACCLRPGVAGWSDNIRVVSLVGRFLEHSRIYYFANGGEDEVYLGSADLMERNLDRRVEVVFPVEDRGWAAEIRDEIIPAYWRDTTNAWELLPDGTFRRIEPALGDTPFDVHSWLINRYKPPPDWALAGVRVNGPRQVPLPATGPPGLDFRVSNFASKQSS